MNLRRFISFLAVSCLLAGFSPYLFASSESFTFSFRVGSSSIDSTYKYNTRASARIKQTVSSFPDAQITIVSYSSPDGKISRNRQLSALRAASALDFLVSLPGSEGLSISSKEVSEDWDGVRRYLERSSLEWKQEALAIVNSSDVDRKSLLQDLWVGEAWDDLVKNCFPLLRRVEVTLCKQLPADNNSFELYFTSGSSRISRPLMQNQRTLDFIKGATSSDQHLYIYVSASPDGDEAANGRLSHRRAESIKALVSNYGFSGTVEVKYLGEDWNGLADLVKSSTDIPDREAVLDILSDASLDRNSRKKALQNLSYGKTWLRLLQEEMPLLRKATLSTTSL